MELAAWWYFQQTLHTWQSSRKKMLLHFSAYINFFFLGLFFSLFSPLQKIPGKFKKLFTELESLTVSMVLTAEWYCLSSPAFLLPNLFGGCMSLFGAGTCHVRSVIC